MSALTLSASGPLARSIVRFVDNRAALFGLAVLVPMLLAILTYPLWLPYKPNDIDLLAMNAGPSATHWFEVSEADYAGFRSLSASMALAMALPVAIAEKRRSLMRSSK